MRKTVRIALLVVVGLMLLIGGGIVGIYWALQHVPQWYREATEWGDPEEQRKASDRLLQRIADLQSGLNKKGNWEVIFTTEQINGWLAVDRKQNHPDLLPEHIHDPRVTIEPDGITLGCRIQSDRLSTVASMKVDVYLAETNVVGVRIRRVRAGRLPWPFEKILDGVAHTARQCELPLKWRQAEGDPVALITIPPPRDAHQKLRQIETIQLGDGEIYIAGTTQDREDE